MSKIGVTFRGFWVSVSVISVVLLCFCNAVHGQFQGHPNNQNNRRVRKTLANIFRNHRDFQSVNGPPNQLLIPPGGPGKMPEMMNFPMLMPGGGHPMPMNEFQLAPANIRQPKGPMAPKNDRDKENVFLIPHNNDIPNDIQEMMTANQQNFHNFNAPNSNPRRPNPNGPNRPQFEGNNQQRFPRGPQQNQQGFHNGPPPVHGGLERFQDGPPRNPPFPNPDQSQNRPFQNQGPPLNQLFPNHEQSQNERFFNDLPRNPQMFPNIPDLPQGEAQLQHLEQFPRNAMQQSGPLPHQMHQQQHDGPPQQQQQNGPPQQQQHGPQQQQQNIQPPTQQQQQHGPQQQQHGTQQQQHGPQQQHHGTPQQLQQHGPPPQQQDQQQHQQQQHGPPPQQQHQQQKQHQPPKKHQTLPQKQHQPSQQQHHAPQRQNQQQQLQQPFEKQPQQQRQQKQQSLQEPQQQNRFHRQPSMPPGMPNEFPPNQILRPPLGPHDEGHQDPEGSRGPFNFRNHADAPHHQQLPGPPDGAFGDNFSQRPRKNPGNQQRGPPPPLGFNPHNEMQEMPFRDQNFQKENFPLTEIPNDLPPIMHPRPFLFPPPPGAPPMGNQLPQQQQVPKVFSDFPSEPVLDRGPWIPMTSRPHFDWRPSADGRWVSDEEVSSSPSTRNSTIHSEDPSAFDGPSTQTQDLPENQSDRDQLVFESELDQNSLGFRSNGEGANLEDVDPNSVLATDSTGRPEGAENVESSTGFSISEISPAAGNADAQKAVTESTMDDAMQAIEAGGLLDSLGSNAELESLLNELQQGTQQQVPTGSWYRNHISVRNRIPEAAGRDAGDYLTPNASPLPFDKHFRGSLTPNLRDLSVEQLLTHFQAKFDEGQLADGVPKDLREALDPFTQVPENPSLDSKMADGSGFPKFESSSTPAPPTDWSHRTEAGSDQQNFGNPNNLISDRNAETDSERKQEMEATPRPEPSFDGQLNSPINSAEGTDSPNYIGEADLTPVASSRADTKSTRSVLRRRKFPKRTVAPFKVKRFSTSAAE